VNVESGMLLIQVLLLVLIVLVWQMFRWLKVLAMNLGCNPKRTARIHSLLKQLERVNLSAAEKEQLDEEFKQLCEFERFEVPCKAGQGIRIIERLQDIMKLLEAKP
jgi:hypothetical protein